MLKNPRIRKIACGYVLEKHKKPMTTFIEIHLNHVKYYFNDINSIYIYMFLIVLLFFTVFDVLVQTNVFFMCYSDGGDEVSMYHFKDLFC